MLGLGRCIAAVRCVFLALVSTAAILFYLHNWRDEDEEGQVQRRDGAQPQPQLDPAAREALARHMRRPPRVDTGPEVADGQVVPTFTPLSAAETVPSPALSDASWELPEAALPHGHE
ncbi:unnamed protein product [Effrenium voratum]|nr:unnamed protein product [Effrenium voratum]|mmetsp:Transcript_133710/g.316887  ORF Transcript_133710/g.316887 Transcript_133710/m.316887 type:complete len:117 (+) Transcript_133710:37-387(+)